MKKLTKKMVALVVTMMMVLAMGVTAFAATGSYTITIGDAVVGETYKAYKIFDADYDEDTQSTTTVSYTATKTMVDLINSFDSTAKAGLTFNQIGTSEKYNVVYDEDTFAVANFAAALASHISSLTCAGETTAVFGTATVINGLSAGYYFVDTSLGSVCSLNTAKNVTIKEKNAVPTVTKLQSDSLKKDYSANSLVVSIGDEVYYQVTVTNGTGTDKKITVHDIADSQITIDTDSIVIKNGDTILKKGTEYSVEEKFSDENHNCTFDITFTETYVKSLPLSAKLVITYTGTLNDTAAADTTYSNKTWLTYSEQKSDESEVKVSTADINIFKYDKADVTTDDDGTTSYPTTSLAGATFQLKQNGNVINLVKLSDTSYRVATSSDESSVDSFTTTAATSAINIYGLDSDLEYTLTETDAPDGYMSLTDDVTIYANASTFSDIQYIENVAGTELPSTGGIGTTLFYVIGAILVLGAGVLLVTRRRMSAK